MRLLLAQCELVNLAGCSSLGYAIWGRLPVGLVFLLRPLVAVERSPMMLSLAHMTPLLVPTFWAVFAAGVAVGALLGYRLGLLRMGLRKSAPNSKDS